MASGPASCWTGLATFGLSREGSGRLGIMTVSSPDPWPSSRGDLDVPLGGRTGPPLSSVPLRSLFAAHIVCRAYPQPVSDMEHASLATFKRAKTRVTSSYSRLGINRHPLVRLRSIEPDRPLDGNLRRVTAARRRAA